MWCFFSLVPLKDSQYFFSRGKFGNCSELLNWYLVTIVKFLSITATFYVKVCRENQTFLGQGTCGVISKLPSLPTFYGSHYKWMCVTTALDFPSIVGRLLNRRALSHKT